MAKTQTILLTGSTGLLAKGMIETKPEGIEVVGIHLRNYPVDDGHRVSHHVVDLLNAASVEALFERYRFQCVVHAAGIGNVDYVETHPEEGMASNLHATMNIVHACRSHGIHLVYISTNAVFDGDHAPYSEQSSPNPINRYGRIKLDCEKYVADHLDACTILRPILMYGWHYPDSRMNPVTWLIERFRKGDSVHMVHDVYENPLYNIQCGEILWRCVEEKPYGIIHAAGGEIVNRYEFALGVAEIFGYPKRLVEAVDSSYFPAIAPRPLNTSFDTSLLERKWGIHLLTVREGLQSMREEGRWNE